MKKGKLLWAPYPYKAGFSITDDTDAADMESVRTVYDFLKSEEIRCTRTVWPFKPTEPCGLPPLPESTLRGITLEYPEYMEYCKRLHEAGFEIAPHGASGGNNPRDRTNQALGLIREHFPPLRTYICHSKNAENVYWESKVAANVVLRFLLGLYFSHSCSGETEGSRYFWGNLCRENISWIRLFRTRKINTLAANPSMPYYEKEKPLVNGWFSATKRSFKDCTAGKSLDRLVRERGLTVLYQYMHRYADLAAGEVKAELREGINRLNSRGEIWIAPVREILDRLSRIHHLFMIFRGNDSWLINANSVDVHNVQIELPEGIRCIGSKISFSQFQNYLVFDSVPGNKITRFQLDHPVRFSGPRCKPLTGSKVMTINFGHATLKINMEREDSGDEETVVGAPSSFKLTADKSSTHKNAIAKAGRRELFCLLFGQILIILREMLFKGRGFSSKSYLGKEKIPLEDHNNW